MSISKTTVKKWSALFVVILLQLGTVYFLENTQRFYIEKQQLIKDSEFLHGANFWQQEGSGAVAHNGRNVSLYNDYNTYHSIVQNVRVDGSGYYRVSIEASIKDVRGPGTADVGIVSRSELGAKTGRYHSVFSASGSRALAPYSHTLHLVDGVGSFDLVARLSNVSGQLTISSPTVSLMQELPAYKRIRAAILTIWGLVLVAILLIALRVLPIYQSVIIGCTLTLAMVGVLLPEGLLPLALMAAVETIPNSLLAAAGFHRAIEFSVVSHFSIFLLLGAFLGFNFRKVGAVYALAGLVVFAVLTEILQMLVVGRTTSGGDVFVDLLASVIGVAVGVAIQYKHARSSEPRRELPGSNRKSTSQKRRIKGKRGKNRSKSSASRQWQV